MIVTIDGPAGTGKSTVARQLAQVLGFEFLDTGAMYRMVALAALDRGADPEDAASISRIAEGCRMEPVGGACLLDGMDVAPRIRSPEVTRAASLVAQHPGVREILVRQQRQLAVGRNFVCEGRDQGTVAFPMAEAKFFLTADPRERATRRGLELEAQGRAINLDELLREQAERDQRDKERAVAPLRPAEDAREVDTTSLSLEAVVESLAAEVRRRMT